MVEGQSWTLTDKHRFAEKVKKNACFNWTVHTGSAWWKVTHGPSLTKIDSQKRLRRTLVLIGQYAQGLRGGRSLMDPH